MIWYAHAWFGEKLTGGPSGKNAGFTCGATGGLGKCGTMPKKRLKMLSSVSDVEQSG